MCPARVEVDFKEVEAADLDALAIAMDLPTLEPIQQRLQTRRRCFFLRADGQIASYGWVTRGVECVGELDRQFHLPDDEAYIWDCGTVPAWRGQRCYSALLSHIIYQLHREGVPRLWIGASRLNRPSVQGFVNAGFQHVIDLTYRRFYRLTWMWLQQSPSPRRGLVAAAYRILLNNHERRLGRLVISYKHE
jgi:GNAT superfamily N-acetyltransferase